MHGMTPVYLSAGRLPTPAASPVPLTRVQMQTRTLAPAHLSSCVPWPVLRCPMIGTRASQPTFLAISLFLSYWGWGHTAVSCRNVAAYKP